MLEGFVEIELVLQAKSTDGHREERFFVRFFSFRISSVSLSSREQ